jgi:hypothetical protein
VTGPNFIHREVAVAAAEAGKHVWVEKPAGRNAAETRAPAMPCVPTRSNPRSDSTIAMCRQSQWPSS